MTTDARQRAYRLGHLAELCAVWRLRLAGYSILARRGGILAFIEVKARADYDKAGFSLYTRQFGRVARAASLFLAHHPRYAAHSVRFDAILVVGWWPRHLPDVWRAPE